MKSLIAASLLVFSTTTVAANLSDLNYITEVYPPFNYEENGQLKGIAVDFLEAATEAAGEPITRDQVKIQPWARGYATALSEPNTVLFSTTRTEEREDKFKWVGPITDTKIVVWAPKSKGITINSGSDFANYKVGVVRDDVGEHLLRSLGVSDNALRLSPKADLLAKQLAAGRVDMWAYEENVSSFIMSQNNVDTSQFEVVYVLSEAQLYYSLSKSTPDSYVEKLQAGVDKAIASGALDEIKSQYK
ncbi:MULTISPECIES: substrate-binding periplasmic protein [Salinivibrio]|uniref:ABC transporter substrate-binding protein n=1 Tax=Salinivibrio costicola TaxID=51367 RepID=A0ABX6K7J3_SALCS|nr:MULTISPECIES: transporter substrate-binding domain-containing protein [Salinivibrio]ODQ00207.1 amino acid ABC transporter substrate-binding protein [Salinivibrio sp. DV]OOF11073.1 amino acid ABC transporter substrate-binding protein [Salinivibrio sp. PR5]OOF31999.1 amino acid ABC transporter substrate-binding protein [Salinivibrio proteolyticus]PCE67246.1 amino acid ABC transporter substrate-binding protein [Salinivibrio sp. YCSC6]QCF35855.1 transporter substrate-binding domain-containing p